MTIAQKLNRASSRLSERFGRRSTARAGRRASGPHHRRPYGIEAMESRVLLAQVLTNPSFTDGAQGWLLGGDFWAGTNLLNFRTSPGYAAAGVSSTGAPKNSASGAMSQQVTIPANAATADLQFWYFITSDESPSATADFDKLAIQLTNTTSGTVLLTQYSNRQETTGYVQSPPFSLLPWRGQTFNLAFVATTNAALTTVFRLDDITLTVATPDVPASPTNLEASVVGGNNNIWIAWSDNSNNESGFHIERRVGATGLWGLYASTGADVWSFRDFGVQGGNTYYYRVYAYNAAGPSAFYTNEAWGTIPHTLRVTGEVTYRDVFGMDRRAAHVRVEAWERQTSGLDVLLAVGSTDAAGVYSLDRDLVGNLLLNSDIAAGESGTRDIYVVLRAENEAGAARDNLSVVYAHQTPVAFDVPGSTHIRDIALTSSPGSATSAEAWGVPGYLKQSRDWLAAQSSPAWIRTSVNTYIPLGNWPSFGADQIYLPENWRTWGASTIAHEYGHAVQYAARGGTLPPGAGPDPHYLDSVSSEGFALKEGWAEFFQHAVFGGATDSRLEQNAYWFGPPPSGQPFHLGNVVEGAVASVLWDLHDGVGDDGVGGRFNDIWRVLLDDDPDSIWNPSGTADFYQDWNARYGRSRAVDEIFIDHGMPVADDEFENNDDFASSYQLPETQQTYPDLILADAGDTFGFYIDPGGAAEESYVRLSFDDLRGKLDLYLFDAQFNLIGSSTNDDNLESISLAGRTSGQYYLSVIGTDRDYSPDYDLTLNVVPPPNQPPTIDSLNASPETSLWDGVITLSAAASDPGGSVVRVSFYLETNGIPGLQENSDKPLGEDASFPYSVLASAADQATGDHTYYAVATDNLGLSGVAVSATNTVLPNRPPTVDSFTDSPDPVAPGGVVTLSATASDPDEKFLIVFFYRESNGVAGPQTHGTNPDLQLGNSASPSVLEVSTAGLPAGTYTYYAYAIDTYISSETISAITNTIQRPNEAPAGDGISPSAASDGVDTFRTFTARYHDANGAGDIDIAYLRVVNASTGKVLTALYYGPTNKLHLVGDDGASLIGGSDPGAAGTITNSLGTLDAAGTSVSRSGDTLTVTWKLSAKAPLVGANSLQLLARDRSFAWSPITAHGSWTVTTVNAAPVNGGITPSGASDNAGVFRTFTARYSDANGSIDIDIAYLRVLNTSTGAVFMALYYRPTGRLHLVAENGSTLLGGFTPGTANFISNSLGTIDVANTTVTDSGNTLTINWAVSAGAALAGSNSTQLLARDRALAWSPLTTYGSWSVSDPANVAPTNVGLTPSPASDPAGTFRTFTAQYADTKGASDIDIAYLRVANPSTGGVLTALYYAPTNRLYLLAENGTTLLGGFAPGSANTISNTLGTLNVTNTSVSRSGNTLTVNWTLSAKATMAGTNSLQLLARDRSFAWSPLTAHGSWTIQ
jgi:hypothetical protein